MDFALKFTYGSVTRIDVRESVSSAGVGPATYRLGGGRLHSFFTFRKRNLHLLTLSLMLFNYFKAYGSSIKGAIGINIESYFILRIFDANKREADLISL